MYCNNVLNGELFNCPRCKGCQSTLKFETLSGFCRSCLTARNHPGNKLCNRGSFGYSGQESGRGDLPHSFREEQSLHQNNAELTVSAASLKTLSDSENHD